MMILNPMPWPSRVPGWEGQAYGKKGVWFEIFVCTSLEMVPGDRIETPPPGSRTLGPAGTLAVTGLNWDEA